LREIKAPKTLKAYIDLLQGYMYLRTYRKNIISKAHYLHLPLLFEIGRRMGVGSDITLISYEEMINFLKNNEIVSKKVIGERKEAWAVLSVNGQISIISGKKSVEGIASKYGVEDVKQQASQKQVKGQAACLGKATGKAIIIKNIREFGKIKQGDVLITPMTTPDYVPVMKKVAAIVTDEGGVTCHAAIVSREFNIPCIVGTSNATKVFSDGDLIEVDANTGIAKIV
jgi:pyruvate,water dikinase